MKLRQWRISAKITQPELADALGTVLSTVARYENGTRMPEPETMRTIYTVTDGAVQPNDFYDLPPLGQERRAA